jgi:hypothetical protein
MAGSRKKSRAPIPARAERQEPRASSATGAPARGPVDLARALVEAFLTNERINQVLLDLLEPAVWRAQPPCSKRRNIATSFAHMHNVRCMRLKLSGTDAPARLERAEVTPDEARKALAASARAMAALIEGSLARGGRVRGSPTDVVGVACAAITHEAHHRGQICHWARELGAPIVPEKQPMLWDWHKRQREIPGNWT